MSIKQDDIIPEAFIVTISSITGDFKVDIEIPANLQIGDLRSKLLDILKYKNNEKFFSWHDCRLRYKNRLLSDSETLATVGAFDGSRLIVIEE